MSNCLKIIDAMPQADQDALLTRVDNYQDVGMTPKQAQLEAARETLKRLVAQGIQQSAREQTETAEFKRWFKDSKVVDAQGKPLVVYHGTNAGFAEFMKSTIGKTYGLDEEGFFFAGRHEAAGAAADDAAGVGEYGQPYQGFGGGNQSDYGDYVDDGAYDYVAENSKNNKGQNILPVYLNMQNPLVIQAERGRSAGDHLENVVGNHNAIKLAKDGGHDGIIIHGDYLDFDTRNRIHSRLSDSGWRTPSKDEIDAALKDVIAREDETRTRDKYYIVFEPTQIKSIFNNGDWDVSNPNISKSARSPLGFFSALSEGIDAMPTKQAMAGAWMSQIKGLVNKGVVKQDELEWSGLEDWLKLQEGKVTKEQITAYLDANGVQVDEVVRSVPDNVMEYHVYSRVGRGRRVLQETFRTEEEALDYVDDAERNDDVNSFEIVENANPEKYQTNGGTKYEWYKLPGGENYREVLLTLPTRGPSDIASMSDAELAALIMRNDNNAETDGLTRSDLLTMIDSMDMSSDAISMLTGKNAAQYKSRHWEQPNVLAHLRVDDRVDADENKVLFVEELQSDWGQEGKKKGFKQNGSKTLPDGWAVYRDEKNGFYVINNRKTQVGAYGDTEQAAIRNALWDTGAGQVSAAPFVDKTDKWLNLVLKRVITMAVQGGYDKVAFINGQQSADRYDLSKQVSQINYDVLDSGEYNLEISDINGRKLDNVELRRVAQSDLEDVVGKEVAEKIVSGEGSVTQDGRKILSGLDLEVGGKGMKTFYDSIVPNATKALLKKLGGGQMEEVKFSDFTSKNDSADDRLLDDLGVKVEGQRPPGQPGFSITPAMREKVSAGIPLFSKRDTEAAEAAGFDTSVTYYHGTTAKDFKSFRYGKDGVDELGPGIYFTSDPWYAEAWAGRYQPERGGRIIPVYLKKGDLFDMSVLRQAWSGVQSEQDEQVWKPMAQRIIDNHNGDYKGWNDVTELAARIKDIGRQHMNEVLHLAGYVGAFNKDSQIPGQVVVFDARNIRSPWAKFSPKKADSANLLHSKRDLTDTPEFKAWSQGLDLVKAGEEYTGGPAVLDEKFGPIYNTTNKDLYYSFPEKKDYDHARSETTIPGERSSLAEGLQQARDSLRDEASTLIREAIDASKAKGQISYSIRPEASGFDDLLYKWQNKHIDTRRVVDAIKTKVGQLADDLNVYLQEELFHGRAAKRVKDFGSQELDPLMEQIKKDGYSSDDIEEYLLARQAEETNKVIAQRNPGNAAMQDGGSGMMTADAQAYMASLSAADAQKLAGIAAQVDAIIAQTRQLFVDYGLEDQATVDGWKKVFPHYIPLQREGLEGGMGIGQGFSVKGKETKGRTGSTRKVVDVLANIALQREKLIVRGEKNRVATALVGLVMANPEPDFWSVGPPPSKRVYDPKTNTVVDRVDPTYKNRDEVLVAKVRQANGLVKEVAVIFNKEDPRALRMAQALKNLDAPNLEGLLGVSANITRYFSSINTSLSPIFGFVNLIRDVQGAMINLGETPLAGKRWQIAKDTLPALAGIYADMRAVRNGGTATSPWAQDFEEYELEGGQTGFRDLFKTSADRAEALQKILTPDAWMDSKLGKIFTANGKLKVPVGKAKEGAGWILDWLSDYNGTMENAVRLAAYKAAKNQGMTNQQAASLAKNLTVNFNRKGQVGSQAGAVYAFFNAAMQGSARMGQTLFTMQPGKPNTIRLSSTGKRVVYGGIMVGTMQALALAAAGFGDDDPPEFLRERSLIFPTGWSGIGPDKGYVSIPMPLGFHVIPGIGRNAAEFALSGFKKPQKRIISMIGMFMDAFNPIGNAGLSMQTLAPTALDPLVALTENKDWTGRPIARTSSNKAIPGHTQFKDTAAFYSKWLAGAINTVTGGNEYVAGELSPTPDQIDYLIGQATGGVGREFSKATQTGVAIATGEELPTYKIPLVGRFIGNSAGQANQASVFYDNVNKLNELETEVKGMRKDGKATEAAALVRSRPDAYLIARANVAERQVQRLRREKRELIKRGAERSAVKAKDAQITETMMRLNVAIKERG